MAIARKCRPKGLIKIKSYWNVCGSCSDGGEGSGWLISNSLFYIKTMYT